MNMPTNTKAKASTITAIILALISGIILIASIVEISTNNDNPTSGPIAMTDGCCYGGLGFLLSCCIFSIAWLVQVGGLYFFLDNQNEVEMIPPKD
jgi:hypothetical protein|tara:strand:+ start:268 stop:552 length:285 start_codon:yes stop_codon:yes gene_type:complete